MLLTVPSFRLTWGGNIGSSEIWQCSLTARVDAGPITQADVAQVADDFADRVATFMADGNVRTLTSNQTSTNRVRAYYVPANTQTATLVAAGGPVNVLGVGNQLMPNQCARVFSLRSSNPGRRGRGRFYLPCLNAALAQSQLNGPGPSGLAPAAGTFLSGVNEDLQGVGAGSTLIAGSSLEPITGVVVDSVIDTQRRRRNALVPVATATGVVTGGNA